MSKMADKGQMESLVVALVKVLRTGESNNRVNESVVIDDRALLSADTVSAYPQWMN